MADIEVAPFANLKNLLELSKTSINDYPKLKEIVARVKSAIETYIGYSLIYGDYSKSYFQMTPTKFIYLDALPIISIYSVLIDGNEITDYKIMPFGLLLSAKVQNASITVTYEAGYDDDTYPDNIKEAALIQTCYEYGTSDNIGATVTTTDGGTVERPELGLLTEVKRTLSAYRNPAKDVPY